MVGLTSRGFCCRFVASTSSSSALKNDWPIARTHWTRLYLNPIDRHLSWRPPGTEGRIEFDAMGDGVTFLSPSLEHETEITGPVAAKLFVSSSTADADIFLVLRVFSSD